MGFIKKLTVTIGDETFDLGLLRRWESLDVNWSDRMIIVHMLRSFAMDVEELDSSQEVHDQYRRDEWVPVENIPGTPENSIKQYREMGQREAEEFRASLTESEERALDSGGPDVD